MTNYSELSDVTLVTQLKVGDGKAFEEIYERYSRILYRYASNMVRDNAETEDLIQEIFISLWNNCDKLELKVSLSSYLYSAVRYRFFNLVSRKKIRLDYAKKFQSVIDEGIYSTDHYINEKELIALIEVEVSKLPDKMRNVFELSRNVGLSHQQIAVELNITEKTVRNHINHALKILRGKFELLAILLYFFNN